MYLTKIIFGDYQTLLKRIFYLFIILCFTCAMLSSAFYNLIGSLSWSFNQLKDSKYVGILKDKDIEEVEVKGYAQMMGKLLVAKPNFIDPVYLPNSLHANVLLSNEEEILSVLGKGNILYTNSDETNQLPIAWIDYNTAKKLKLSLNDTFWVLYMLEKENEKPIRLDFEFQLYGIIRPYFGLLSCVYNDTLVVLEKKGLNQYLQNYDQYITYPLSPHVINEKTYYVTLDNNNSDCIASQNILDKNQLFIESVKIRAEEPYGKISNITIPIILFFTSTIITILITWREYVRNYKDLLYSISLLNTLGLRISTIKGCLLSYQLVFFLISITAAIVINKIIIYEFYLGKYYSIELALFNFLFYTFLFLIIIFSTKHIKNIKENNILTYQFERGAIN